MKTAKPTAAEGLLLKSEVKEFTLKPGIEPINSEIEVAGKRYLKIETLATWEKKEPKTPKAPKAPKTDTDTSTSFEDAIGGTPAAAPTTPTVPATPPMPEPSKAKRIPKYSRYEVTSDGQFRNATTGAVCAKEAKGDKIKVRLTSDTGSRDWVDTEQIFNELYQPEAITGKPKKEAAKPATPTELSKSQKIWLEHSDNKKTIKEIMEIIECSVESHIRNVIKDYTKNPDKAAKAERVRDIVKAQEIAK